MEARGGSSAIPALDFALRTSQSDVVLVGLDLGYQIGSAAEGSNRDRNTPVFGSPKFLSMRAGLERVLADCGNGNRRIFHVLERGVALKGTLRIRPRDLLEVLNSLTRLEMAHAD